MTDFHKWFMVKINKMIKKEDRGIPLVVYVIYGSHCLQIARKLYLVHSPECRLYTICATFIKCKLVQIQDGLCLFHYVLNNQNWFVFVCFAQFNKSN